MAVQNITKESNPEVYAQLFARYKANNGAPLVSMNGVQWRAYDRGGKFISVGDAGGMQYYDNVSMSQGANRAHVEESLIPPVISPVTPQVEIPAEVITESEKKKPASKKKASAE